MSDYDQAVDVLSAAILANLDALDVEAEAVALTPEQEALLDSFQPMTAAERQAALDDDHDLTFDLPGE